MHNVQTELPHQHEQWQPLWLKEKKRKSGTNRNSNFTNKVQEEDQVKKKKERKNRGERGMTEAHPHQNKAVVGGRRYKEMQREAKREGEWRAETGCLQSADRPEMTHSAHCHC